MILDNCNRNKKKQNLRDKMQLELERSRPERETDRSKTGRANQEGDARIVFGGAGSHDLALSIMEKK